MFNRETGDVVSKFTGKAIAVMVKSGHRAPFVVMSQNGRRRYVYYHRLMYALKHGIAYDDMPSWCYVMENEIGDYVIADASMCSQIMRKRQSDKKKAERFKRIDEKMAELAMIRRAYVDGSHKEIMAYIENRKDMFVRHFMTKHCTGERYAEYCYAMAFERMIWHINDESSIMTTITTYMMREMDKARLKMKAECKLNSLLIG